MDPVSFAILIGVFAVMMIVMSRVSKKQRQAQLDARNDAIKVGNNVVTVGGFLGRIVDVDGDAVTLASPSGDETVWLRDAIRGQMDIPLAVAPEEDAEGDADEAGLASAPVQEAKDAESATQMPKVLEIDDAPGAFGSDAEK